MIRRQLILPLAVAMGLGLGTDAFGQSPQMGGRVGAVLSSLGGDGDYETELGLSVGVLVGIELGRAIGLYPELAYVQKGAQRQFYGYGFDPTTGNPVESTLTQTVNLHYLELYLPVALQMPFDGKSVRPRLYAGPSLALELDCGAELKLRSETFAPSGELLHVAEDVSSGGCEEESFFSEMLFGETASFDFGLVLGIGVDIALGSGAIGGEIRYDLGLKDITTGEDGSLRNRALYILVGYSRHLGSDRPPRD